ncbi:MAG: type IV pilin-like G/H family protein [Cyanobacteria bacterium P01_E01_bin.42]
MKDFSHKNDSRSDRTSQHELSRVDGVVVVCLYFWTLIIGAFSLIFLSLPKTSKKAPFPAVNAISRAQHAYFLEHQAFARRLESLPTVRLAETEGYSHRILFPSQPAQTELSLYKSENLSAIASIAYPKRDGLRIYIGIVQTIVDSNTNELTTQSNFCRSISSFPVLKAEEDMNFGFPYFVDFRQIEPHFACPVNFENLGG